MALYKYIALDKNAKKYSSIIDAESLLDASEKLTSSDIVLIDIKTYSKNEKKKIKLSFKELLNFTSYLARLLKASLPLYEALIAIESKYKKAKFHPILLDLCDQVKNGKSLSDALSNYKESFDVLYCSMVKNGEKIGNLASIFEKLHVILSRQANLKKKLTDALLYPAILSVFCIIVVTTLMFFVLPSLFELFEQKQNLHPFTKIVLSVSMFCNENVFILLPAVFLIFVSLIIVFMSKKFRKKMFLLLLKIKPINNLLTKASVMRFCLSFSSLLSGGVSFINALSLSKTLLKHPLLEEDISLAEIDILEGKKLSSKLQNSNFPDLVAKMISLAEDGGDLPSMLTNISQVYEYEFEKSLTSITTLLQPIILLFLGVVIGFIVLSVLLPLTDVSSFISN
jgi:general secretion pathway protein F